jgi:uncharacterized Zn finger protein
MSGHGSLPWVAPPTRARRTVGGIRARSQRGEIADTWWSRRFIDVLESFGLDTRLSRGRSYARQGQVLDLEVAPGEVRARVQGSRRRPYEVRIGVRPLAEIDWTRAELAMAERVLFMAKLLAGEMPHQIEEAFQASRVPLFPRSSTELASSCTCPDWVAPCKHVAAAYYILAEAFDRDPFLIFAWRGRTRDQLIQRLQALREGEAGPAAPEPAPPLDERLEDFYELRGALAEKGGAPRAAETPDALLRQMGPAGVHVGGVDLADLLGPLYQRFTRELERRGEIEPRPRD